METIQRFGHTWDITPLQAIRTRFSAIGDVSRLTGPDLNEDETVDVRFTMVDGWDRATVRPHRMGGPKSVTRSIKEGSRVRVDNAMPSLWKGQLNLDLDSLSSISPAEEGDEAPIVDIETRVSVVGRVWSIDAYPDGDSVSRWAITLVDASGSASAVAFKQFIPTAAASISRGDVIGVLNGEVGEWAGRPQIKMGPGTRVVVIENEA
jgi:ssDNA-binding replication factor A large subunit